MVRSALLPTITFAALASFATLLAACNEKPAPPVPFDIAVLVESDPGAPLAGAQIVRDAKTLGTSGPDGRAKFSLDGKDGDGVSVQVKCPDGYESPPKPIPIVLRRTSDKKIPEYKAACPPSIRKVVVAIRADNGPFLPVTYLGKPVARTDAAGAAHVLLAMKPGDQFELGLDTSSEEKLTPPNPVVPFTVKPYDDIQAFDVKFTRPKPKPVYHAPPHRPGKI